MQLITNQTTLRFKYSFFSPSIPGIIVFWLFMSIFASVIVFAFRLWFLVHFLDFHIIIVFFFISPISNSLADALRSPSWPLGEHVGGRPTRLQ